MVGDDCRRVVVVIVIVVVAAVGGGDVCVIANVLQRKHARTQTVLHVAVLLG